MFSSFCGHSLFLGDAILQGISKTSRNIEDVNTQAVKARTEAASA
jgi:hypothetical protein